MMKLMFKSLVFGAMVCGSGIVADEIHEAVRAGDIGKIQALLAANPEAVNAKAKSGGATPLHVAMLKGNIEVVKALLAAKPEINAIDSGHRETPLYAAAGSGRKEIVELLIGNGADVNAKARDGSTALHTAARKHHKEIVAILLANKADANAVENTGGLTPLHLAASVRPTVFSYQGSLQAAKTEMENSFKEIVDLLLANNADINARSKNGRTPLQLAVDRKCENMAELLRKHGAKE